MSNLVQAANAVNPQQAQSHPTALAPKPAPTQTTAPQDKVTISESAKQALTSSTRPAGSDSH